MEQKVNADPTSGFESGVKENHEKSFEVIEMQQSKRMNGFLFQFYPLNIVSITYIHIDVSESAPTSEFAESRTPGCESQSTEVMPAIFDNKLSIQICAYSIAIRIFSRSFSTISSFFRNSSSISQLTLM